VLPPCEQNGECNKVVFLEQGRTDPHRLFDKNRKVAEIIRRTLILSDRNQIKKTKGKGKKTKEVLVMVPTFSHLSLVLENFYESLSREEKSNIIYKISKVAPIIRARRIKRG